jgi:Glyoxalase-like domain
MRRSRGRELNSGDMNMAATLDHVTLGASSLEAGAAYMRTTLGAAIPAGGKHADMGTHNCVMRVGDGVFLELLAIDPAAAQPARPRWFGMDDPEVVAALADSPRPIGWVVSTSNLDEVIANSPVPLGEAVRMSRGGRSWRITVTASGQMPYGGLVPAFIEWSGGPHPSNAMSFPGPRLERLELRHPDGSGLRAVLEELGVAHLAVVEQAPGKPSLTLAFGLPDGTTRTLA